MPGFHIATNYNCVGPYGMQEESAFQGPPNTVETARKHRYSFEVLEPLGTRDDGLLLYMYKCSRPGIEFDEAVIHNGQDEIHRPSKHHFKPIEFTFYERLNSTGLWDSAAETLYKWWSESMLNLNTSNYKPVGQYLKNAQLDMLDGAAKPVWVYHMYDCWPSKVSPCDLDYTDSAIADITVTLRYSRAIEKRSP